jgi:hypothetical protein
MEKRQRSTKKEMLFLKMFIYDYCSKSHPVTVRGVFYQCSVAGIVSKEEEGYRQVQKAILNMRRSGIMPQHFIADNSRSFYQEKTYYGLENASHEFANSYKLDFWKDRGDIVEVWLEKEALAGVIMSITNTYRVRLVPTRGFASETILYSAIKTAEIEGKSKLTVMTLYDFDRAGQDAQASVVKRMQEVGNSKGIEVQHEPIALNYEMTVDLALPHRPAKSKIQADRNWPYPYAVELDAIPPETLRKMVEEALERHMPQYERENFEAIERHDRSVIEMALSDVRTM